MSDLRQAILGILAALACAFVVLGSLALALAESRQPVAQAPTNTSTSPPINTPLPGQPTYTPSATPMPALTPTPAVTSTCPQPPGWERYIIQPEDSLTSLALKYKISLEELKSKSCIEFDGAFRPGYEIFVPLPQPTQTPTPTATVAETATAKPRRPTATRATAACIISPPYGWVVYTIQPRDTLFSIGQASSTTVAELMAVNCLKSYIIRPGKQLFVRRLPPSRTPVPTRTPARTATPTSRPPTPTPTETHPPTLPPSDTRVPTNTRAPTDTPKPPSDTPIPSNTPGPDQP